MHTYRVYFSLQPNMTSNAEFQTNEGIEEFYKAIVSRGYIIASLRGSALLIPAHSITAVVEQ